MTVRTATDVMPLSDYGILGYGIDIVNNEPLQPLADFTYTGKKLFSFDRPIFSRISSSSIQRRCTT